MDDELFDDMLDWLNCRIKWYEEQSDIYRNADEVGSSCVYFLVAKELKKFIEDFNKIYGGVASSNESRKNVNIKDAFPWFVR